MHSFDALVISLEGTIFGETDEMPITIEIGMTGLKGWDRALAGMCRGEVKRVYLPPDLAYGQEGLPGLVPPNSVIILDIKMVEIRDQSQPFLFQAGSGKALQG